MGSEVLGYARVSTAGQDVALQIDALQAAGVGRIYEDVGSGTLKSRPQLDACLDRLRAGDTLVVWKLDRLGRSLRNVIELLLELDQRHVTVRSLTEAIDTSSAMGRFQIQMLAALAELEASLIQERTRAGLESARARGRTGGRPSAVTARKLAAAVAMRDRGELTMREIAAELGVGQSTLYRHLAGSERKAGASDALSA
jgi:DNA invertase Pin-like site-specific DNA recombinase